MNNLLLTKKQYFLLMLFVLFTSMTFGQTTLISPTVNNGGFETNLTGWSTAQNNTNNKGSWYTGTATSYAGTRSAYISNNTGTANAYAGDAARIQHLYRAVTFPAGETNINLSFYWKTDGEGASNDWDNLKVFVSNTAPTAGTANAAANQVGATWYNKQTTWQNASITLPAALAGTTRYLIFQWKQDASFAYQPPAAIDNISLISQVPPPAPSNNSCYSPISLSVNPACVTTSGTTVSATQSLAGCSGTADDDVWYSFTATNTSHTVTVTPGTLSNAVLQIYSGNCAALTNLDCENNTAGSNIETTTLTGLTVGTSYLIRVYSFNNGSGQGTFNICVTDPIPCTPVTDTPSAKYITQVQFLGTLNDVTQNSTYSTSPSGYQDFTGNVNKARQAQGEGVNIRASSNQNVEWKIWIDWNRDGVFSNVAPELIYSVPTTSGSQLEAGFEVPATATPGDYRMRIKGYMDSDEEWGYWDWDACDEFTDGWTYDDYGEAEDYLFTVIASCDANITTISNGERCNTGTVTLNVTGTASTTGYNWYATEIGGSPINSTPTGTSWTTPSLTTTTTYWVTAVNSTCESLKRTPIVAKVNPTPVVSFTPSAPVVCGDNAVIQLTAGGDVETAYLIDEDFESGGLGVFSNINNDTNDTSIDSKTMWQNKVSVWIPNGYVWFPAISSGFGDNKFVMATSDVNPLAPNEIENSLALTNSINTTNFTSLTLKLKAFYSRYLPNGSTTFNEYVNIEVSRDGGSTYPYTILASTSDIGIGSSFQNLTFNLNAHINQTDLKIRIRHHSHSEPPLWTPDGVAVDDIELFGERPLTTAFNYATTGVDAFTDISCAPGTEYTPGTPATTVYIKPSLAQLENASFTIPVTATLSSGCSATGSVVVTNNTKMFTAGTAGTDWNNAANWRPAGIPTADNCVVIYDNDVNITGTNYTALGRNLTIKPTGNLNVAPTNTALITDFVNVEAGGIFEVEDDASLVQENNVANTVAGTFNSKRIAVTNSYLDYVYWSSPVAGFSINNITPSSTHRYAWSPTTATGLASDFGNWTAASGAMTTGRGYIVRGSSGNTTFAGVPNNGDITIPISRSTYMDPSPSYTGPTSTQVTVDDDNWNLLGNPYPSALSADAFLTANFTNLETFVKIWKHGIDPAAIADPFYQDYQLNYDTNDYLTFNRFGGTQDGFDGYIGSGQGFFVLMRDTGATTENAIFNNTMRSNSHRNDQFYRTTDPLDRHRIWIKIISPTNTTNDMLVGYAAEATNAIDDFYDTKNVGIKTNFELYSLIENKGHLIQARALPFDTNDQIPLGVKIAQNGIHTIAISAADGLFGSTTQDIYLEDRTLGITHDLRTVPYSFTATPGTYENRFVLKFNNETLGTNDLLLDEASVWVFSAHHLTVKSSKNEIQSVRVFDLLGRALAYYPNVNSMEVPLTTIQQTDSGLIIQVTLSNGAVVTKKTIY